MLKVSCNNIEILLNRVAFSDGAFTYKLDSLPKDARYIWVVVDPSTPVYLVREELIVLGDCFLRLGSDYFDHNVEMKLSLDYFPYARCDRKFEDGNPIMLTEFCYFLVDEFCYYDKIYTCDIHNNSIPKMILCEKLVEKSQLSCFKESLSLDFSTEYDIVLSPDKGSREKARTIAKHLKVDVFNCEKERDIETGKIIKSVLPAIDLSGKKILIPDDLLDGGYTFYKLAELLKKEGALQVDLYVTHMIGSKGLDLFKGLIDNIYCYQIVGNYLNKEDINNFNSREEK